MTKKLCAWLALSLVALVAMASCSAPAVDEDLASATDEVSGTLTVFAAASLKATFDQVRELYRAEYPQVDFPEITYGGSPTLVTQIEQGAPVDVFAAADQSNMDKLAGQLAARNDFVTNTLQIAVAPGNPLQISSLADLARDDVVSIMCAAEVPCGAASHQALESAGVTVAPVSEEDNVKAVLTKVATGDADAGLVYRTDVVGAAGEVEGVDFPQAVAAVNVYPIAVLNRATNPVAATAFVDMVLSDAGGAIFAAEGFGTP